MVSLVPEQSQGERMGDEWHRGGVGGGGARETRWKEVENDVH